MSAELEKVLSAEADRGRNDLRWCESASAQSTVADRRGVSPVLSFAIQRARARSDTS
jgi:hypothetical protein